MLNTLVKFTHKSRLQTGPRLHRKYNLNVNIDNTPAHLKTSSKEQKLNYLENLVTEALKDLIPFFKNAKNINPDLDNHPFKDKRDSEVSL